MKKTGMGFIVLMLMSGAVMADGKLGDILGKKPHKVTPEEWKAMLPVTETYVWFSGDVEGEATLTYKSDGTFSGTAKEYVWQTTSGSKGTWEIDPKGKICIDEKFESWGSSFKGCWFTFKVGDQYYVSLSDTDPASAIRKATLK